MSFPSPFSPDAARAAKRAALPDFVINAVNELLAENYMENGFTLYQKDIVKRIEVKMYLSGIDPDTFDNKWLDIEPVYEDMGWKVSYDKPAYNETYEPTFSFRRKK